MLQSFNNKNTNKQPLVSVMMNCYNGAKYLKEAIESVSQQTYSNWEIIFWDNQSTDGSAKIFQNYNGSRYKYFFSPEHTNLGAARAAALRQANGELICILDVDDVWYPEKLDKQVPLFADKDVGIVISDTLFFTDDGKSRQYYGRNHPPTGRVFDKIVGNYYCSSETIMLRKIAIDSLEQSFDPEFHHISDYDLIVRISYKWKLAYVPEVLAKWRIHPNSGTSLEEDKFVIEKKKYVQKLDIHYRDFQTKHKVARENLIIEIALNEAKLNFCNGSKSKCRQILRKHIWKNWKASTLYFLTFFPFSYLVINYFKELKLR